MLRLTSLARLRSTRGTHGYGTTMRPAAQPTVPTAARQAGEREANRGRPRNFCCCPAACGRTCTRRCVHTGRTRESYSEQPRAPAGRDELMFSREVARAPEECSLALGSVHLRRTVRMAAAGALTVG